MEALVVIGLIGLCLVLIAQFVRQMSRWVVILTIAGIIIVVLAIKTPT